MTIRIAVRVYIQKKLRLEQYITLAPDEPSATLLSAEAKSVAEKHTDTMAAILPGITEKYGQQLAAEGGWIELEFLDEADPLDRFIRLGTDPSQMTRPMRLQ